MLLFGDLIRTKAVTVQKMPLETNRENMGNTDSFTKPGLCWLQKALS